MNIQPGVSVANQEVRPDLADRLMMVNRERISEMLRRQEADEAAWDRTNFALIPGDPGIDTYQTSGQYVDVLEKQFERLGVSEINGASRRLGRDVRVFEGHLMSDEGVGKYFVSIRPTQLRSGAEAMRIEALRFNPLDMPKPSRAKRAARRIISMITPP